MSTTWHEVETAIQEWARCDWLSGCYDSESVYEWAHETTDGCEYVIYYHHQDSLWTEGTLTPVHEAEVNIDWLSSDADIQQRIQACVYSAIYEALVDAANNVMESDSALGVRQSEQYVRIHGEGMFLPMLETYRVPRERV